MLTKRKINPISRLKRDNYYSNPKIQAGIVLIEVMIALVLFSVGILALLGLQTAMLKNTTESKYRADAAYIAQQKLGEIWVNTKNHPTLADYSVTEDDISTQLPSGKAAVAISAERVVTVTITWQLPGELEHNYTTNARVEGI